MNLFVRQTHAGIDPVWTADGPYIYGIRLTITRYHLSYGNLL